MADNPFEGLSDLQDVIEEGSTLSTDPKRVIAKKTTSAYIQASLAAALTLPLAVSSGVPTISNVQARKPDESIPAQGNGNAEPMRSTMVVAVTSPMNGLR